MAVKTAPNALQAAPSPAAIAKACCYESWRARSSKDPARYSRRHFHRDAVIHTTVMHPAAVQTSNRAPVGTTSNRAALFPVMRLANPARERRPSNTTAGNGWDRSLGCFPPPAGLVSPLSQPAPWTASLRPILPATAPDLPAPERIRGYSTVSCGMPRASNQTHCQANINSKNPASTCGLPNVARLKNWPMRGKRVLPCPGTFRKCRESIRKARPIRVH